MSCTISWLLWPSLTLTSDLSYRKKFSQEHISYIIRARNLKIGLWIHLKAMECHILFPGHCDLGLDLCLEKSSKINFALKSTWKTLKGLFILPFTGGFNTVFGDLNQYKIELPLFGAAYAEPKKVTTIYTNFLKFLSLAMPSSISKR